MQLLFSKSLLCKLFTICSTKFSALSLFFFFLATPHCIWDLSFPISNGIGPPALQAQSLNCCPTRKVPQHCLRSSGSQLSSSWASASCASYSLEALSRQWARVIEGSPTRLPFSKFTVLHFFMSISWKRHFMYFVYFIVVAILCLGHATLCCGMWDLSSPIRDWTHPPCFGSMES